jgi:hypothetical protein
VEAVGRDVRNLRAGDRVVIPSTIACGTCSYCDVANPNGKRAGTAFFGHLPSLPPLALDPVGRRFAVGTDKGIEIIRFSP